MLRGARAEARCFLVSLASVGIWLTSACTMDFGAFRFADQATTASGGNGADGGGGSGASAGTGAAPTGGGGAGALGGGGSTATGGQGGSPCNFTAPDSCASAEDLGALSGDEDDNPVSRSGVGSKWFRLHLTEDAGPNHPVSYTVTLTSPAGTSYELYVYQSEKNASEPDCDAQAIAGQGNPQVVSEQWNDDEFGFDNDDVMLAVEVRYASGSDCTTPWELELEGHT